MKDRLFEALKKSKADYTEIRFETNDGTALAYRGKEIEDVSSAKLSGGIVRACVKGGWGTTTFDALDDLDYQVAEAVRAAERIGCETTAMADAPRGDQTERPAKLLHDFRGVSVEEKLKVIGAYNEIILGAGDRIESSSVRYSETFRTVHFASSRGAYFMEERPRVILSLGATARDGSLVQQTSDGLSSIDSYEVALNEEARAAAIAKRALDLLKAPPVTGGTYSVVLDPDLAGVFAHEAFGHLSEADFLYENKKMSDLMHIGREMGGKELSIVDDGTVEGLIGSHPFDDEGTPTRKNDLIRDGVLVGHLHSLETAAKMKAEPTGNARAIARGYPPIVRMTNTYIEPRDKTFDELIGDLDDGIYACQAFGGQTMMEVFTFSAGYGYRIENGKLGEMVRDVVLTGNVFETLHAIDGIGNDLNRMNRAGGCGKGGQFPLPVTCGSPHLRIRDVVIGGKEGAGQ